MERINLFGASGHAKVIADIIKSQGDSIGTVYDDSPTNKIICGIQACSPKISAVEGPLIISIGSNRIRRLIAEKYDLDYAIALHVNSSISDTATIDEGTVVMPRAVVEADAKIGKHCIINTAATVNHECLIGDFVHLSPGSTVCGNVKIGDGTWIGAGATVIQGISIGKGCTIGAGAVVISDVPDGATVVGNPGRVIKISKLS